MRLRLRHCRAWAAGARPPTAIETTEGGVQCTSSSSAAAGSARRSPATSSSGGHTVAVIDKRSEAFARLGADFTGQTIAGIGFDRDRLREAGIERAGAVAAVTNGDNSNILIARVARETFGIERVVARIYDPRRAAIYQRLGIPPWPPWRGRPSGCCGASCPTSPPSSGSTRAPRSC